MVHLSGYDNHLKVEIKFQTKSVSYMMLGIILISFIKEIHLLKKKMLFL